MTYLWFLIKHDFILFIYFLYMYLIKSETNIYINSRILTWELTVIFFNNKFLLFVQDR